MLIQCTAVNYSSEPNFSNRDYSTFNRLGKKYSSTIFLLKGSEIKTNYIYAKNDSLSYSLENDTLTISVNEIEKIIFKQWTGAIAFGAIAGIVASFASGGIIYALVGDGLGESILISMVGIIFGLSAFVFGVIYGGKTKYIFNDKTNYEQIEYYKGRNSLNSKKYYPQSNIP